LHDKALVSSPSTSNAMLPQWQLPLYFMTVPCKVCDAQSCRVSVAEGKLPPVLASGRDTLSVERIHAQEPGHLREIRERGVVQGNAGGYAIGFQFRFDLARHV
jgi:hypothetical protein